MIRSSVLLASAVGILTFVGCAKSSNSPSNAPSPITIGSPADSSGNGDPFGDVVPTYQQVYAGSLFGTAPVKITGLTFPHTNTSSNGSANVITPATYTFSLSTTTKAVDGLDTTTLTNNIGADNQTVFSGALSGTPGSLVITATTFTFNPAAGNLLLTITQSAATCCGGIFFDSRNGTANGAFSRAGTGVGGSGVAIVGTSGYGLVTTFTLAQ